MSGIEITPVWEEEQRKKRGLAQRQRVDRDGGGGGGDERQRGESNDREIASLFGHFDS